MPTPRLTDVIRDMASLRRDVHDIDTLLREARERLSGLTGQVRVIVALLIANGLLNLAALFHKP